VCCICLFLQKFTVFHWVQCAYKYSAHLNFTIIFDNKNIFIFQEVSKEIIIASLFIIKAILNPFSATFHVVHREYFRIIFNVEKCALYLIKYSMHSKKIMPGVVKTINKPFWVQSASLLHFIYYTWSGTIKLFTPVNLWTSVIS